jgi:phosphatidylglycerol lysyltransferase
MTRDVDGWAAKWLLGSMLGVAVLVIAVLVLRRELTGMHLAAMAAAIRALPPSRIWAALGLTGAAYLVLPGYDLLAFRQLRRRVVAGRVVLSSLLSYAISHTLGFALITGGSVRMRFWRRWGLDGAEMAKAMSAIGVAFLVGLLGVTGAALLFEPSGTAALLGLQAWVVVPMGGLCLLPVVVYLVLCRFRKSPLRWRQWRMPLPSFGMAVAQLGLAAVDWTLAAAVFAVLLPSSGLRFGVVLGAFVLGQSVGLLSHVPGGLGVFEGVMVVLLGPAAGPERVLAALLGFRVLYYLVPFGIGALVLGALEAARSRAQIGSAAQRMGWVAYLMVTRWIPGVLPRLLGVVTFAAGVVLLFSGATPPVHGRMVWLRGVFPLGVIELSHFLASVAGGGLMVVGWALTRRLGAAYRVSQGLLVVGIVGSLLKGLDWEEALLLTAVLALLLPARRAFYRKAAISAVPFSAGWVAAIVAVVGITLWLGAFSYRHVQFSSDLWWRFAAHRGGYAPRYLRAMVGVLATLGTVVLARLFRHASVVVQPADGAALARAMSLVQEAGTATAHLALLGDKTLLMSENGAGFLMYRVLGRSWVAMGDPVGGPAEQRELVWRFREMADRHGGWTVFYEVSAETLPLYLDLGLRLLKLGEEALVPLRGFSLEGSGRRALRRAHRDVEKAGAAFEVLPRERVEAALPQLREVSERWLEEKRTREKGFSLGRFDPEYLKRTPVATVSVGGRVVAFANLWCAPAGGELSMDLMRYVREAPAGVMTYLVVEVLLWGRAAGYQRFNLGMAPLSGFEARALAPLWIRAGAFLSRHGEHYYNFQGLRQFKDKFDPVWRPRYLASPGGLALPRILANTAALVSGGIGGVVGR